MEGDLSLDTAGARRNSIRLEQGGRAYAELIPSAKDDALWSTMFRVAIDLANKLAKEPKNLEYWRWSDRQWHPDPPAESRDGIGSSQHEGGTLFMGKVGKSITDADGKFHHLPNVYVVGPAVFPTIGDANPSLTGLTLARRTAKAIARRRAVVSPRIATPSLVAGSAASIWHESTSSSANGKDRGLHCRPVRQRRGCGID